MCLAFYYRLHTVEGCLDAFIGCGNRDTHVALTLFTKVSARSDEDASFVKEPVREVAGCESAGNCRPDVEPSFRCPCVHTHSIAATYQHISSTAVNGIALLYP